MSAGAGELSAAMRAALARLVADDTIGQLRRREGAMAQLGSEGATPKLDWVEAVPWLLAHPERLAEVEDEARSLLERGVRHVIWAGMGGSVLTVQTLRALGYCDAPLTIYPLDSTDPAALNALVRALAAAKGLTLPAGDLLAQPALLRALLDDVALIAVAMGMTSEEPISHLAWFSAALEAAGLPLPAHLRAMTLPGSFLDDWAQARGIPRVALQLDGGSGTGGRMSAPGTRVFLLPVALWLAASGAQPGELAGILRRAWASYDLDGAQANPASHRFVQLAAALSAASVNGAVRLAFAAPGAWRLLRDWSEQLFEESLGKGGKGVVVFAEEATPAPLDAAPEGDGSVSEPGALRLRLTASAVEETPGVFALYEPLIVAADARARLAGLAALFLGLQLTMALYGYLHAITFAGQPAVEDYKARARALRDGDGDPIPPLTGANSVRAGRLALLASSEALAAAAEPTPRAALLAALRRLSLMQPLPYLDVTINGEPPAEALAALERSLRTLAVERLGVAYKLRRAPAAYHSTEQSEMDGPPALVSLRALALRSEPPLLGAYSPRFLQAQAVATWQAMLGVGRICLLALDDGDLPALLATLTALLDEVAVALE